MPTINKHDFATIPIKEVLSYFKNEIELFKPFIVAQGMEVRSMFLHNGSLVFSYNLTGNAVNKKFGANHRKQVMQICKATDYRRLNDEGYTVKWVYYAGSKFVAITELKPCECMERENSAEIKADSQEPADILRQLITLRSDPQTKKCREKGRANGTIILGKHNGTISGAINVGQATRKMQNLNSKEPKLESITPENIKARLDLQSEYEAARTYKPDSWRTTWIERKINDIAYWLAKNGTPPTVIYSLLAICLIPLACITGLIFKGLTILHKKLWHRKIFRAFIGIYTIYALASFGYIAISDMHIGKDTAIALLTLPPIIFITFYGLYRWYGRGV